MPTSYTTLLGLALPVQGELQGTWGDEVNNYITNYLDASVAGTQTLSTDADVTLTKTTGTALGATSSQYLILNCTGSRAAARNITVPAQSKAYVVINGTTGGFAVTLRGAGPTTGVSIAAGERAVCVWNGSDFVKAASSNGSPGGSTTQVQYNNAGALAGSANLTFDGTSLTLGGNPTLSAGTANGVLYLNGSKAATSGSALTFDGTNLGLAVTPASASSIVRAFEFGQRGTLWATTSSTNIALSANGYLNAASAWTYKETGTATAYQQDGAHKWLIAASGTAGTAISFTTEMQLTSTGLAIALGNAPTQALNLYRTGATAVYMAVGNSTTGLNGTYFGIDASSNSVINTTGAFATIFSTNNTERMRLDSSGNLGLGVTPSAWKSDWNALDIETGGIGIAASLAVGAVATNAYLDSSAQWIYKSSFAASLYEMTSGGQHRWYISTGVPSAGSAITFTQAMTLDADGELGVGITSPTARVHAYSTTAMKQLTVDGTGAIKTGVNFASGGTTYGQIYFDNNAPYDMSVVQQYTTGSLIFGTNSTERARITSGGYFKASNLGSYLSSTGDYHELRSNTANQPVAYIASSSATNPYGIEIDYTALDPNGTGNSFFACYGTTTLRAGIRSNGGIANYQANDVNLSDRREKTNFAPAKDYLDTICAIPVQTFNYIDQSEDDPGLTLGVVAQDVQAVAPELVHESNWGTEDEPKMRLSVYQTDLQYALMKCIQEQQALITDLRARVAQLERQA